MFYKFTFTFCFLVLFLLILCGWCILLFFVVFEDEDERLVVGCWLWLVASNYLSSIPDPKSLLLFGIGLFRGQQKRDWRRKEKMWRRFKSTEAKSKMYIAYCVLCMKQSRNGLYTDLSFPVRTQPINLVYQFNSTQKRNKNPFITVQSNVQLYSVIYSWPFTIHHSPLYIAHIFIYY